MENIKPLIGIVLAFLVAILTTFIAELATEDGDDALEFTRWCLLGGSFLSMVMIFLLLIG